MNFQMTHFSIESTVFFDGSINWPRQATIWIQSLGLNCLRAVSSTLDQSRQIHGLGTPPIEGHREAGDSQEKGEINFA